MKKPSAAVAAAALAMAGYSSIAAAGPSSHFVGQAKAHAAHRGDAVLYSQDGTDTLNAIVSQNFEATFAAYSAAAADDFHVPSGQIWCITEVDVLGQYFNGSGPSDSVDVTIYKDAGGKPGDVVSTATGLSYTNGSSFHVKLPPPKPSSGYREGTYWVSVVANMAFGAGGEWGWEVQTEINGGEASWQDPGGGFGFCSSWDTIGNCFGTPGDFMFALIGTQGKCPANVLYNQAGNDSGLGSISQNFETSLNLFDAKAVDDFLAPAGGAHLRAVKVFGKYHNGTGPARDETVTLYLDNGGKPGTVKKQFTVAGVENGTGSIYMHVPQPYPPLIGGNRYWLAVQANLDFLSGGEWAWDNQTTSENLPAMWRNPLDGFATGCIAFMPESQCFARPRGDHRFILYGTFDSAQSGHRDRSSP